jgi:hypothetical protein
MAMGSTANQNIGTVKSTCKSLEVSPSCHSKSSPIAHGGTRAVGHGVKEHTGKLAHGSTTRPKPRGTAHHMGKKDLMAKKSRGR